MSLDTKVWNRNVILYSISSFVSHFELIASVFVLYLFSKGLSMTEAMVLQAIFIFIIFITEVPSGVFADLFGLKTSLVLSNVFMVIGFLVYSFADNFWEFLPGEVFIALAWSFYSGTNSAFLYDSLKEKGVDKEFKKIKGFTNALVYASLGIASILGGIVLDGIGFFYVFFLSVIGYFIGAIILLFTREPKKYEEVYDKKYFKHLRQGFEIVFKNLNIKILLLFFGIISGFVASMYMIIQPYFNDFNKGAVVVGIGMGIYFTISGIASYFADSILKYFKGKDYQVLLFCAFGISVSLILMYFSHYVIAFLLLSVLVFAAIIKELLVEHEIHDATPSSHRATVMSVKGMTTNTINIIILLIAGVVIDKYSSKFMLLLMGIVLVLFSLFSIGYLKKVKFK